MPPVSVEKSRILGYIARALGEEGVQDAALSVTYPATVEHLPTYLSHLESLELHLGLTVDRGAPGSGGKPLTVDLYLPTLDLYLGLDREGHDLTPSRLITLDYYPPGLPMGFDLSADDTRAGK